MAKYNKGLKITDQDGRIYTLDQKIGRGGQGVVWTLKEGALAVKFLKTNEGNRDDVRRRIQRVNRLGLEDLPVAVPWVVLQTPSVGYIMKLVRGLQPLSTLSKAPKESVTAWYLNSGSLKWRLRVLSVIAEVLSKLHSKGLAFADPSPNNFMISPKPSDTPKAYLIDADNMEVSSQTGSRILYTPRYGAPELVNEISGVTTLSDAYAFAVLAFEVLTLRHPLIGDDIDDGESEEETKALAGHIPWIDHSCDNSNWCERGIYPREIVLSPPIKRLFKKTFEDGLNDPQRRPGMGKWADELLKAADRTVCCNNCNGSYYSNQERCPWCDSPVANTRLARFLIWDPESTDNVKFLTTKKENGETEPRVVTVPRVVHSIDLQKNISQKLHRRHFFSDPLTNADSPIAEITLIGKDATVHNLGTSPLYARTFSASGLESEREISPGETKNIPADGVNPRWYLHVGSLDTFHRALAL